MLTPAGTESTLMRVAKKYTVDASGCWLWTGAKTPNGYGQSWFQRRGWLAHRLLFTLLVGPIPDGRDLDHLCRVRHCVNPSHLEPVTRSENLRRGVPAGSFNRSKTECPRGHAYDEANTYRDKRGRRQCRQCRSEWRRCH